MRSEDPVRRVGYVFRDLMPFKMRRVEEAGPPPPDDEMFSSESSRSIDSALNLDDEASTTGPTASSLLRRAEDDLLTTLGIVREDRSVRDLRSIARSWGTNKLGSAYAVVCALGGDIDKLPTDPSRIYFVKTISKDLWDTAGGQVSNNLATRAVVRGHEDTNSIPLKPNGKIDFSMKAGQELATHGIAFKVTTNPFEQNLGPRGASDHVAIHCTLKDVLEKGEIYKRPNAVWENSVVVALSRNEISAATRL